MDKKDNLTAVVPAAVFRRRRLDLWGRGFFWGGSGFLKGRKCPKKFRPANERWWIMTLYCPLLYTTHKQEGGGWVSFEIEP